MGGPAFRRNPGTEAAAAEVRDFAIMMTSPVAEGHASPGILASLDETVRNAMRFPKYRPVRYRQPFSQMNPQP